MKRFIAIVLTMILILSSLSSCASESSTDLKIDVIDVGKADCIIIRSRKETVMIDTGEEENLPEIEAFLKAKNIKNINCLILSHFDKDHIGGAEKIISSYNVKSVLESSFVSDSEDYSKYHIAANEKNVSISKLEADTEFSIGDMLFSISIPKKSAYEKKEDNNASLVVSLKFGDCSFLFCGDAMEERMDEILQEELGKFNLVKLPHHGSYIKRYDEILSSFDCKDVIVTDSDKNPADEGLLSLLTARGIHCHETRYGTISVICDGKNVTINQ